MKSLLLSFPKLLMLLVALWFFEAASAGGGEEFIPPIPDKTRNSKS